MNEYGIKDVLREIRSKSMNQAAKGTSFEILMKRWLLTDPRYKNLEKVWLWSEFPSRKEFGSGHDLGIDLVAKTDLGEYWAIQCKCYAETSMIDMEQIATFIATSSKTFCDEYGNANTRFSQRVFISTTNAWNSNAESTIQNQTPPFIRISLAELENSPVDWKELMEGKAGKDALLAGKQLRKHQSDAIAKAEAHYEHSDRGKLVMACGTGKTFTSLRLVEQLVGEKGLVLFMVPSIGLLGQSLNDWATDAKKPIRAICICSDSSASKKSRRNSDTDEPEGSVVDLALPASTSINYISQQLRAYRQHDGLVVVFSTYQSIDVISEAQKAILKETKGEYGVFDFIVCDEAHRTTGVKLSNRDESNFTKIHSNATVQGKKRLYMTATPRLYGANAKIKASKHNCVLCSMDDETLYGKEFHRVSFDYAVQNGILTDYKVLVLTVAESMIPDNILKEMRGERKKELNYDDVGRLIGVISGLSKQILGDKGITWQTDPKLMRRALAFTHKIGNEELPGTSKNIEKVMPLISEMYNEKLPPEERQKVVNIKARHVDGSMGAAARSEAISWLSAEAEDPNECRVLTNVRCLSEGIDVPALDAVIFLSARNSQVDVVQSVGRVMRSFARGTDREKKYGYIIIPIVVPENTKPEEALNDNKTFSMVWEILNALRAHDDHFNALVNTIALNEKPQSKITVGGAGAGQSGIGVSGEATGTTKEPDEPTSIEISGDEVKRQLQLRFGKLNGAIFAKLVEHCGDRTYWEKWGKSVGDIAKKYIERITRLVEQDEGGTQYFNEFTTMLRQDLNPGITDEQCIEMLAQHMVTRPVFEALFGEYKFVDSNPISHSMQFMMEFFETVAADKENETLKDFYDSVRTNVGKIDNLAGKQTIVKTLYERFFKEAFPLTVSTMGIVYTPVECVDFIIHSVDEVLKREFGTALTNEKVHVIDPFVGTGTFITRLMQSGVIKPEDMLRKYKEEMHCNEIVLLAYYIAAINIESVFHELHNSDEHTPYTGICLTDTFQLGERGEGVGEGKYYTTISHDNTKYVEQQIHTPIRVIIGNPPYSVGQRSANDNAQNQHYPTLERRIADTYARMSKATNRNALYDSYIKAFRWATDRIDEKEGGIVAFISNGAWIDGNAQDGFRATLAKDFDKIYVFNLRGNCNTQGERRKKEGGGIFGEGSKTPIAITLLVKYPRERHGNGCTINYYDIGDYLTRQLKLKLIRQFHSIKGIPWQTITPNEKNDWINQRDGEFDNLLPLAPEKKFAANSQSFFSSFSRGIATSKDSFLYNSSREVLAGKVQEMVDYYNKERERLHSEPTSELRANASKIVWTRAFKEYVAKGRLFAFDESSITDAMYRPFCRQRFCYQKEFIEMTYRQTVHVPLPNMQNLQICVSGVGVTKDFSCIITDKIPDLELIGKSQCFPLYWYKEKAVIQKELFEINEEDKWERQDGITDWILREIRRRFRGANALTKEDIFYYVYGLLHSPDYRTRFAADLRKALPRIPIVDDAGEFMAFSKAGRQLAELHLGYESVPPHPNVVVDTTERQFDETPEDAYDFYSIPDKMRFPAKQIKTTIIYNANIRITNIPEKAYEYVVNGKSAIEWLMERYQDKTDKVSGIRNNCNDWAREHQQPRYILDLLLSVINLSTQTVDIVNSLPRLHF